MKREIGIITIGQAPRKDILPIIYESINPKKVYHVGVLDGLTDNKIAKLAPEVEENNFLETILNDGCPVLLSQKKIMPLLKKKIAEVEAEGCKIIWLLCTGTFPELKTQRSLLVEADELISGFLKGLNKGNFKLGVLLPVLEQQKYVATKYQGVNEVVYTSLSPYELHTQEKLIKVIDFFRKEDCDLILLDCMGYQVKLKNLVQEATQTKVILPNQWIARMLSNFY